MAQGLEITTNARQGKPYIYNICHSLSIRKAERNITHLNDQPNQLASL